MSIYKDATIAELLGLHVNILDELRERGVLRTANNPTGDLAEHLFCAAFGWQQAPNSEKSFDAQDSDGSRYQIKGRRLHRHGKSRQLSAIRDLDGFDYLATVLFDHIYGVMRAALIPASVVKDRAVYNSHTNSYIFLLVDDVWTVPGVSDETLRLKEKLG